MPFDDRDIAIIVVLGSIGFLAMLTVATYRCNPSLFQRQHRHRPGTQAPRTTKIARANNTERIDPEKLTRFASHSSLRSYATPAAAGHPRLAPKESKASSLATTSEVSEETMEVVEIV